MSRSLDSRQLQAFVAVARRQSFTLGAKDLHLTQSAVSHALRSLEDDLGCRLLDRVGRRVALTHHGEQFLRRAEALLREMERARTELEDLTNWGHGRLRVGASTTVCQHLLPTVLREFKQSFPRCVLRIEPGDLPWQLELLQRGTIDIAVSLEPEGNEEMTFVPLFEDELRLMVGPMHPWAQAGRATREQLGEELVMLYNKNSSTYALVQEYFGREGVALNNCIQLGSMEAIKELVKVGLGAGVLAPWVVRDDLAAGRLVSLPLGRRALKRRWGITYLAQRQLTLGEETFVGLCQSLVETMGLAAPKAAV